MIGLFCFLLAVLGSPFKSNLRLEAENAVLRHQLIVLRRRLHGRVRLTNQDRWFLIRLVSLVSINPGGSHNHPARDARTLAQGRLPLLLASFAVRRCRFDLVCFGDVQGSCYSAPEHYF